jgi:hypothetical protein
MRQVLHTIVQVRESARLGLVLVCRTVALPVLLLRPVPVFVVVLVARVADVVVLLVVRVLRRRLMIVMMAVVVVIIVVVIVVYWALNYQAVDLDLVRVVVGGRSQTKVVACWNVDLRKLES